MPEVPADLDKNACFRFPRLPNNRLDEIIQYGYDIDHPIIPKKRMWSFLSQHFIVCEYFPLIAFALQAVALAGTGLLIAIRERTHLPVCNTTAKHFHIQKYINTAHKSVTCIHRTMFVRTELPVLSFDDILLQLIYLYSVVRNKYSAKCNKCFYKNTLL